MRPAVPLLFALAACHPLDVGAPIAEGADAPAPEPSAIIGNVPGGFRIIDGDTFVLDGETIRIANIDTPEMQPRARCWAEARLAREAAAELDRIRAASPNLTRFKLTRQGKDRYGRTLALVTFDGTTDAGEALIARGYASPWVGHRWDWCNPVSGDPNGARILTAAPSALASYVEQSR